MDNLPPTTPLLPFATYVRHHKLRLPAQIVLAATSTIFNPSSLSSYSTPDQLMLTELLIVSCLDINKPKLALRGIQILENTLRTNSGTPDPESSTRVRRLRALYAEGIQSWSTATAIYNELLSENDANLFCMKRKYAIAKAQKKMPQAIKELNEYINLQQGDSSAWRELGEVYFLLGDYKSASFSFEEVVLHHPLDPDCHSSLADCYFLMGGGNKREASMGGGDAAVAVALTPSSGKNNLEHLKLARAHYAKAIDLRPQNSNNKAIIGLEAASAACLAWYTKFDSKNEFEEDRRLATALLEFSRNK